MASLLYGLAQKLLEELCSPAFQDLGKSWGYGTKDEFEKLMSTLSAIEAVLLDAEEKQRTNRQVQDWLMKIKLVFYDVEDLLQEVTTESLKRHVMTKSKRAKEVRIFFSSSNQVKYRLKMGRKVKLIRERLDSVALDSNRFVLTQRQEEMPAIRSNKREETHSFVPLEKFIGRDEDKDYVTKLLFQCDGVDNVSVISIVGIGGLGKTSLAQLIYSSVEVKGEFELMMWVCVSDVFNVELICEKIIESATRNKCKKLQMDLVKDELKKSIDGRKYLLVLDDVWNECPIEWMKLDVLLRGGAKGSKILITTRAESVARAAQSIATHVLKGLSSEDSWALFKQVAFKRVVDSESPTIVGIGKAVVEICAGVPLIIKTIGSMLGLKEKEIDWLDFEKNILPFITQDSEGNIVPILKLSYDYLSAPLKRCFAYCAIFPKDYGITKESLIRMWMAHGLLQLDGTTRSLEDVGEQYLRLLLDRCLFEVCDKHVDGSIYSYRMHDLIHDLALSVGGNEYCNLGSDLSYIGKTTRHAWVTLHMSTSLSHAKKLRTFVVTDSFDGLNELMVNELMSNCKQMRVLVLTRLNKTVVPHSFDGLRHLYYLDLSENSLDLLPESICCLYNLQTLILSRSLNLRELPAGIKKLVNLRHLDIFKCCMLSHMPCGMEELTWLQTLSDFVTGPEGKNCCELGELKSLVNLRGSLRIRNLRGSEVVESKREGRSFYPDPLSQLKSVQHLDLRWSDADEVFKREEDAELSLLESLKPHSNLEKLEIIKYGGKRYPSWMDKMNIGISLPNIVFIRLWDCKFGHLPPLGLLPSLQNLRLSGMDGIEYIYDYEEEAEEEYWNNNESTSTSVRGGSCSPKSPEQLFPSLKKLYIGNMPQLERLVGPTVTSQRHFPVLEELVVSDCPLLIPDRMQVLSLRGLALQEIETLPEWVQYLPHLQTLELSCCDNIVSLPEWMGNLTSLQELRLRYCKSLESIPDCMQRLTSLQRLGVKRCPNLPRRCEKETGEDWHNIAHIPNVSFNQW